MVGSVEGGGGTAAVGVQLTPVHILQRLSSGVLKRPHFGRCVAVWVTLHGGRILMLASTADLTLGQLELQQLVAGLHRQHGCGLLRACGAHLFAL